MKKSNQLRMFLILAGVLCAIAVSGAILLKAFQQTPENAGEPILKDHVSTITEETPKDKLPVRITDQELIFYEDPQYPKGQILVAGIIDSAPAGFIRRVTETVREGNEYLVKTEYATLTDVFEKAHFTKTFLLTEEGVKDEDSENSTPVHTANRMSRMSFKNFAFGIGDPQNTADAQEKSLLNNDTDYQFAKKIEHKIGERLSVSGELGFNLLVEVEIDVNDGEIIFGVTVNPELGEKFSLACQSGDNKEQEDEKGKFEKELFSQKLPNFQFFIGPVPVVITNELTAKLEGAVETEGSVETSAEIKAEGPLGFQYNSKENRIREINELEFFSDDFKWNTEAKFSGELTVSAMLHFITKLYDSTGADFSFGSEAAAGGEVSVSLKKSNDGLNLAGSMDLSIGPKLQGSIVVSVPVIDKKLAKKPIFEVNLEPFWEKHWESGGDWKEVLESLNPPELSHTYTTQFQDVNQVTYPRFQFDYPDNWTLSQETVTPTRETVVLKNDRGVKITYTQISKNRSAGGSTGGASANPLRVDISKVANSDFTPGYVQGTDHSALGEFAVVKLEFDSAITDRNEAPAYAVLPNSRTGTADVQGSFDEEFAFWYSSYLSILATAPDGQFTPSEEQEVKLILSSFRRDASQRGY